MVKLLRAILAVLMIYCLLEGMAQLRFRWNNLEFPVQLRKNLALNTYESYRLFPNMVGVSSNGVTFRTDEFGFRIAKNGEKPKGERFIMLGGDSRAFGDRLEFCDSVAGMVESELHIPVYLQALPGGSPAFWVHDLIDRELWKRLPGKLKRVYYVYDREDMKNDRIFGEELKTSRGFLSPRRWKLYFGGYFYSMLAIKVESFLNRWGKTGGGEEKSKRPTPLPLLEMSFSTSELWLNRMAKFCKDQNADLTLVFLPRLEELRQGQFDLRNRLKGWCLQKEVNFLELTSAALKSDETANALFIHPEEGIHLNRRGQRALYEVIAADLKERPL